MKVKKCGCLLGGFVCVVVVIGSAWQHHSGHLDVLTRSELLANDESSFSMPNIHHGNNMRFVKTNFESISNATILLKDAQGDSPATIAQDYGTALETIAAKDTGDVLLALVDRAFLDMAINFYQTCIKAFNIRNYILIGTNNSTCEILLGLGINCLVYTIDKDANEASKYQSKAFLRKMNIRTDMIIDALNLGFSVLHSDIDMYCYKNPFEFISCEKANCDIAALQDTSVYNAGFLYINPSEHGKNIYNKMKEIAKNPSIDDQEQLNRAIKSFPKAVVRKLSKDQFLCGKYFFEDARRYFAKDSKPCPHCIVVHNNWIVSMEAKVYRAKEMLQWVYDGDGYYSSTQRKYLTYDNPVFDKNDKVAQTSALRSALAIAIVLNRTVILPKFNCVSKESSYHCPLNSHFKLTNFDAEFKSLYREHSFMDNSQVPSEIKTDLSETFLITSQYVLDKMPNVFDSKNVTFIEPFDKSAGLTDDEIRKYFNDISAKVLVFHNLYNAFSEFIDKQANDDFNLRISKGISPAGYRQY